MKNLKYLTHILIFSFSVFSACQTNNKSYFEKVKIDIKTVDFIEISNGIYSDSSVSQVKRLTNEQKVDFVEKFNSSKAEGLCKFITRYLIDIYLKDGAKRSFRINGQFIKENNDFCFDLDDSNYIESIWIDLNGDTTVP